MTYLTLPTEYATKLIAAYNGDHDAALSDFINAVKAGNFPGLKTTSDWVQTVIEAVDATREGVEVVTSFPAFTVVKGDASKDRKYGDKFVVGYWSRNHDQLYRHYKLSSVEGYAASYGDDVDHAVNNAKANGWDLVSAIQLSTSIHNGPCSHYTVEAFAHGDIITFEGKQYRIEPANNGNVELIEQGGLSDMTQIEALAILALIKQDHAGR